MADFFKNLGKQIFWENAAAKKRERKNKKLDSIEYKTQHPSVHSSQVEDKPAAVLEETDDLLLSKIDEFREKAKLLQELLIHKECKARELQEIVEEREIKAEELQQILTERQEAAEGVTAEVVKKLDGIMDRMSDKMDSVEGTLREDLNSCAKVNAAHTQQLSDVISDFGKQLEAVQNHVTGVSDTAANLTNSMQEMNSAIEGLSSNISGITDNMSSISEEIGNISDQIHSENVKSYRNTVDLFKEMDDKLDKMDDIHTELKDVRKFVIGAVAFSVINLVAGIAFFALGSFF